ncbi:MAG: hypothetical protein AB1391_00715 [Candidatus Micrarchaeota archaeon]
MNSLISVGADNSKKRIQDQFPQECVKSDVENIINIIQKEKTLTDDQKNNIKDLYNKLCISLLSKKEKDEVSKELVSYLKTIKLTDKVINDISESIGVDLAKRWIYKIASPEKQQSLLDNWNNIRTMKQLQDFAIDHGYEREFDRIRMEVDRIIKNTQNIIMQNLLQKLSPSMLDQAYNIVNKIIEEKDNSKVIDIITANESEENKEKKKENAADFVELIRDMKKNGLNNDDIEAIIRANIEAVQTAHTEDIRSSLGTIVPKPIIKNEV